MKNDKINTMKDSLQIRDEKIAARDETIRKLTAALELIADPDYIHVEQLKDVAKKALESIV
jgi:hypothetical protein